VAKLLDGILQGAPRLRFQKCKRYLYHLDHEMSAVNESTAELVSNGNNEATIWWRIVHC